MTETPLPPPDRPESPIPWDALEDLAAGDLPLEAAGELQARIDREPALRRAYEDVRRLERLLRAEGPYAAPLGLTARILEQLVPSRARPLATLLRVAAAVLVFFSSWLIVGGATPALADARQPTLIAARLPAVDTRSVVPAPDTWHRSPLIDGTVGSLSNAGPEGVPGDPLLFALLGLLVLLGGVLLSRAWHRHAQPAKRGDA